MNTRDLKTGTQVHFSGCAGIPAVTGKVVTIIPAYSFALEDRVLLRVTDGPYPYALVTVPVKDLREAE